MKAHKALTRLMAESIADKWLKEESLTAAVISNAIYMNDKEGNPHEQVIFPQIIAHDKSFQKLEVIQVRNAIGAYIQGEKYDVFAFRGTDDFHDAMDDVNYCGHAKYHEGIWFHTMSVFSSMRQARDRARGTGARHKILFTGHSLGGGCATIAAHLWSYLHPTNDWNVITFGAPRSIRSMTMFPKGAQITRFKHDWDAVPLLPPGFLGFKHVGKRIYIDHADEFHVGANIGFIVKDHIAELRAGNRNIGDSVADHSMQDYLNALYRWNCA